MKLGMVGTVVLQIWRAAERLSTDKIRWPGIRLPVTVLMLAANFFYSCV